MGGHRGSSMIGSEEQRRRSSRLRAIELRGRPLSAVGLHSFPHEVTLCILSHLPPAALCAVECTCRHFAIRVPWYGDDVPCRCGTAQPVHLTLSERAAQRQMQNSMPLRDECYKELLCWGAPLRSWDYTKCHAQLQISSRSTGEITTADATGSTDLTSTPIATCTSRGPVDAGIFPAAVTLPFHCETGAYRVRIRLDGDPDSITPCAVGVCPGDFPAERVSCPSLWYDLCKFNQPTVLESIAT